MTEKDFTHASFFLFVYNKIAQLFCYFCAFVQKNDEIRW